MINKSYLLFQCGNVHRSRLQSLVLSTLRNVLHFQPAELLAILSATMDLSLMVALQQHFVELMGIGTKMKLLF